MGEESTSKHIRNLAAGQQTCHEIVWIQESFHQRPGEATAGNWSDLQTLDHPSHVLIQVSSHRNNYWIRIISSNITLQFYITSELFLPLYGQMRIPIKFPDGMESNKNSGHTVVSVVKATQEARIVYFWPGMKKSIHFYSFSPEIFIKDSIRERKLNK